MVSAYSLRSSIAPVLSIPRESGTFQHSEASIFNKLPVAIRNMTEYNSFCRSVRGVARIFQRGGGGGHTVSNIIVMAFSPRNIVGCLLKKGLQRGGHGHPRTPLATPLSVKRHLLCKKL